MHLANLSPEELFILLRNLRHVFATEDKTKYLLSDDALTSFLAHCSKRIGDAYFKTPRNTIKAFVDLLAILEQNPEFHWEQLMDKVVVNEEKYSDMPSMDAENNDDDELVTFKL